MGRHKTISDDEVLAVARRIFRKHGHTATTREIADAAGISEAILYQRFGSKDDLFFAAMRPTGPDIDELLGPADPPDDAHAYLRRVAVRIAQYFAEVIPLSLHVTTHPSFRRDTFARAHPLPSAVIRDALAKRLSSLATRQRISPRSPAAAARLLVSLAHDWALGHALLHEQATRPDRDLKEMVDVVWAGLRE
jgi:AcrR family transcriptional regulator